MPLIQAETGGKTAGKWLADNHPRFFPDTTDDSRFDIVGCHDDGVRVSLQDEDRVFVEPPHALEVLGGLREQADEEREEPHADLTALRKETASLRAGMEQAAAAKTTVEVSGGHSALLREAARASSTTVLCHRDARKFITAHAGRQPHFRVAAHVLGKGEGRVRAALPRRSLIALLIALHSVKETASEGDGDKE
ncbi:hypothetical protein [Streptomyces atratus]|uniref:hypothetical protein n=1 Tax=Streptomyces atratus TaxID=1893 RepID=UPI0021A2B593|nr:hypothetical protein [Streptomyces atratus]MCT2542510.1 hypothetical protein [Streptomyces atratus]